MTTTTTDAIAMLIADHKKVKALFEQFDKLGEQMAELKATLEATQP